MSSHKSVVDPAWWGEQHAPDTSARLHIPPAIAPHVVCAHMGMQQPACPSSLVVLDGWRSALHAQDEDGAAGASDQAQARPLYTRLAWLGLALSPLWFMANYTYNASLGLTSVASSTVLSTTSSAWTLVLAHCHCHAPGGGKKPALVPAQIAAVMLNICGTAIVAATCVTFARRARRARLFTFKRAATSPTARPPGLGA